MRHPQRRSGRRSRIAIRIVREQSARLTAIVGGPIAAAEWWRADCLARRTGNVSKSALRLVGHIGLLIPFRACDVKATEVRGGQDNFNGVVVCFFVRHLWLCDRV